MQTSERAECGETSTNGGPTQSVRVWLSRRGRGADARFGHDEQQQRTSVRQDIRGGSTSNQRQNPDHLIAGANSGLVIYNTLGGKRVGGTSR